MNENSQQSNQENMKGQKDKKTEKATKTQTRERIIIRKASRQENFSCCWGVIVKFVKVWELSNEERNGSDESFSGLL